MMPKISALKNQDLPLEAALALSVNGQHFRVMMGTPLDLEDFAYGYLFCEGIITQNTQIRSVHIQERDLGYDIHIIADDAAMERVNARSKSAMGPVGCGLCGLEALEQVYPELSPLMNITLSPDAPYKALENLMNAQILRQKYHAMHGAALIDEAGNMLLAREDIGRHNAMDKVIGAALRNGQLADGAALVLSSRVSIDLIFKAVRAKKALIAKSTPSNLALNYANRLNLNLIAPVFRDEYFTNGEIYG